MKKIKISPSLMCANFLDLKSDLDIFREESIDYLHIDIMDGHYVPNFTLGIDFCRAVHGYSEIPLDIHLMIENADRYAVDFASFDGAIITIHPETCSHPIRTLQEIKARGVRAGVAVDPAMPIESIRHLVPLLDMVCVMTVNPGYAGQALAPGMIGKIAETAAFLEKAGFEGEIEVDGNVSWENIPRMLDAGGEVLVTGTSSIFEKSSDLRTNIIRLRKMLGAR